MLSDGLLNVADLGGLELNDGGLMLHDAVQILDGHQAVGAGPGHLGVHLGDDQLGLLDGLQGVVHRHAQGAHAVLIGRRHHDHGHVHRHGGAELAGHLKEEAGGEVAPALGDGIPAGSAHKEGVVAEVIGILGLAVLGLAHGHHVDDLHILVGLGVGHHHVQQIGRLAAGVGHHHPVARLDVVDRVLRAHQVLLVIFLPIHTIHTLYSLDFKIGLSGPDSPGRCGRPPGWRRRPPGR